MSLVDRARERTDRVVLSIFVNPLQFGPGEDFSAYPRDLERDRKIASQRGVDCLFVPDTQAMYPGEPVVRVHAGPMGETLEGAARSGHFDGVLTVVAKLFHLVEPDIAVFGRKDFQQATLVRRMVADLDVPARGRRGADRARARRPRALVTQQLSDAPTSGGRRLRCRARCALWSRRGAAVKPNPRRSRDGAAKCWPLPASCPSTSRWWTNDLQPVSRVDARTTVVVAARVGRTRLIDNVVLGEGVAADTVVRG